MPLYNRKDSKPFFSLSQVVNPVQYKSKMACRKSLSGPILTCSCSVYVTLNYFSTANTHDDQTGSKAMHVT